MVEQSDDFDGTIFGDEINEYVLQMKAKADAFFASAGKLELEVYRIEQFEPILQATETYGKFYMGDSYVVLKKQRSAYEIHYWHGKEATTDEMGSSAALSVQLSQTLPMQSRHHLEEQEMETDLFMSYFKSGLFYLEGGVESGFRKINAEVFEPKLMHIKGKRYPRVFTVEKSASSLNEGDCFVLDVNDILYVWVGKDANMFEKQKAGEIAQAIKQNDRKMAARVEYVQEMAEADAQLFWDQLGGKPASIAPATPDEAPPGTEEERMRYKLWHLSDASGELLTTEITERPLTRAHLNDSDSYILELYDTVYIWQGQQSSAKERYAGLKTAKDFVKNNNKPKGTKITRMPQHTEDSTFKSFFDGFYPIMAEDFGQGALAAKTASSQSMSAIAEQQVKAKALLMDKLGPMDKVVKSVYAFSPDLKSLEEITDPREDGKFFAETHYVLRLKSPQHEYFIHWLGAKVVGAESGVMNTTMDSLTNYELTSRMTRMRVKKGHEDEAFLHWFPNGFAILDEARIPLDEWYAKVAQNGVMFRVQAPFGEGARAIEQNSRSSGYLNSGDSYTVINGDAGFVWQGCGSNEYERAAAEKMFDFIQRPAATSNVTEGAESAEFWDSVGGQGEYSKVKESVGFAPDFEPRLFQVSNASGYMWMEELPCYAQEDMLLDDCYILDAYSTIYCWIGCFANKFEKKSVHARAEKYLAELKDSRNKDEVIIDEVLPGREPVGFTVQFIQWEPEVAEAWIEQDPELNAAKAQEAEEEKKEAAEAHADANPFEGFLAPESNRFTYEVLKSSFPQGVKPTKKEYYLNDEEFASVIGMDRQEWEGLKQFRKDRKKKEVGLF